jgi:hypothetical protein
VPNGKTRLMDHRVFDANFKRLFFHRRIWPGEPLERRTFCSCELCRLRFGRMLYNRFRSGEPLRSYRISAYRRKTG